MLTTNPNRYENNQLDLNLNLHAPQQHDDNAAKDSDKTCTQEASPMLYLQQLGGKIDSDSRDRGCDMKLRKLSDLRDVNLDGGWLQMGITATTDIW